MKKVMLIAIAAMFSMTMFAQTQEKAKPTEKKDAAKPAAKPADKPAAKPAAKPADKPAEPAKK